MDQGAVWDEPCLNLKTVSDWLLWAILHFMRAKLCFRHGYKSAYAEAATLLRYALQLSELSDEVFLTTRLTERQRAAAYDILRRRVVTRLPVAYLTQQATLGGYNFYVDGRVIVPRSHFADLLPTRLAPWISNPARVTDALDLCTGSGCLAIMIAHAFPNACIDAADVSPEALAVAQYNVSKHRLTSRIHLIETDLFEHLGARRYDLIVTNPPYVPSTVLAEAPVEYHHEPRLALAGGGDGLDVIRRIVATAKPFLKSCGLLAVEVGSNNRAVTEAFPSLKPQWIDTASGKGKIFLVRREQMT